MILGVSGVAGLTGAGCDDPCCTTDGMAIPLVRSPTGEMLAFTTASGDTTPGVAVLDTGTPVTLWRDGRATTPPVVSSRTVDLLGATPAGQPGPLRARLRGVSTLGAALGTVGPDAAPVTPRAILGADVLAGFSVAFDFSRPSMTLWPRQAASDGFLSVVGHAVLRLDRLGGGEIEARDPGATVGDRTLLQYRPSRLVLRGCAAPTTFAREAPLPDRCCPGGEQALATGRNVALLLSTGVGPLVLGREAWTRVAGALATPVPAGQSRPLRIAQAAAPIAAEWFTLPRLALVDREAPASDDPGACAELARARRLEQVAFRQAANAELAACALPCDRDRSSSDPARAESSAGYLELAGPIEVAVIPDTDPVLQGIRAEVRGYGPEVDGILGAGTLAAARLEIDYRGNTARAIASCPDAAAATDAGTTGASCRAVGRCPRLPSRGPQHVCFGLPPHGLPAMCDNLADSCDRN
jgi:hypothetical protein